MISTGVIRAVNPVALAQASGVTRVPRFAAPLPPVIRPNLLTTQLMGVCPHCASGNGGNTGPIGLSGFIPPDYGSLRGNGTYGLFKMVSAGHGLGKGATGTHASDYNTRWLSNRGLGKGATGTHASDYNTRWLSNRGLGAYRTALGQTEQTATIDTPIVTLQIPYNVPSSGSEATSVLNAAAAGAAFIPYVGPIASSVLKLAAFVSQFVGKGRREADMIVPTQNQLTAMLGTITDQFRTGTHPSLATLQNLYIEVWMLGVSFTEFVLQKTFVDRRASGQALNTIWPYLDGSCGFPVPVGLTAYPGQQACLTWGDGTLGGPGQNGMLGALSRAITAAGGAVPVLLDPHAAANQGIPAQQAAQISPMTGQVSPVQSVMQTSGLPATILGLPSGTFMLIAGGVLLLYLRNR